MILRMAQFKFIQRKKVPFHRLTGGWDGIFFAFIKSWKKAFLEKSDLICLWIIEKRLYNKKERAYNLLNQ
jgi:hypothetical protein